MVRRLLIVSNGHGEDAIASRLATALLEQGAGTVLALPLVGEGGAFSASGARLLEPRALLPSGGYTLHHPRLAWQDLRAGLLTLTLRQAGRLRASRVDGVLVVGDVYAQAMASLVPAPRAVFQSLISIRLAHGAPAPPAHRHLMDRITALELALLRRAARVYARDEATASWLRGRGVPRATFLGNPIMDDLGGSALPTSPGTPVVALLPGTRFYAAAAALRMIESLERCGRVHALVAWSAAAVPPLPPGWTQGTASGPGLVAAWSRGEATVWWLRSRFADVLASASAVLGTSGTAHEQAAGLGLPVVSFPLPPGYGEAFLANQQRLLGGALRVVADRPEEVADALRSAIEEGAHRAAARREGPARIGPPGGSRRIAADALAVLHEAGVARRSR